MPSSVAATASALHAFRDGTVTRAPVAATFPVLAFASGPTNSMRGAAFLSGLADALVLAVGGTPPDIGALRPGWTLALGTTFPLFNGFQREDAVTRAEAEAIAAAEVANQVQSALADARVTAANARNGVERIEAEQPRLSVLRADVDRLGASVARYNLMDDGFTDFSVALAARIQPKLGEYASDLIERMSNDRYNRLAFDTNYTPALYDGVAVRSRGCARGAARAAPAARTATGGRGCPRRS